MTSCAKGRGFEPPPGKVQVPLSHLTKGYGLQPGEGCQFVKDALPLAAASMGPYYGQCLNDQKV